jgi:hypothetical protein
MDATVGADVAHREAVRGRKRGQCLRPRPGGGGLAGGGCAPVERLGRALAVARLAAASTRARLSPPRAGGRACGCRRQRALPACLAAVLRGCSGRAALGEEPQAAPQAASGASRPRVVVAKGPPVSVRRRVGQPHTVHTRVHPGVAAAPRIAERA